MQGRRGPCSGPTLPQVHTCPQAFALQPGQSVGMIRVGWGIIFDRTFGTCRDNSGVSIPNSVFCLHVSIALLLGIYIGPYVNRRQTYSTRRLVRRTRHICRSLFSHFSTTNTASPRRRRRTARRSRSTILEASFRVPPCPTVEADSIEQGGIEWEYDGMQQIPVS